jgi:hypothetical protein
MWTAECEISEVSTEKPENLRILKDSRRIGHMSSSKNDAKTKGHHEKSANGQRNQAVQHEISLSFLMIGDEEKKFTFHSRISN